MNKPMMSFNETKKCKIVPKRKNFVPDLLLHNQRIEEETVMEINRAEIARAMSVADVYFVNVDGTETLLDPTNYFDSEAVEETEVEDNTEGDDSTQDGVTD